MARKSEKGEKYWNVRCRTWNMARKLKVMENEKHPLDDLKNEKSLKYVKNEKCTLKDRIMARKLKFTEHEKYTL